MNITDSELEQIKSQLDDYKELVEEGNEDDLSNVENSLELSLENGGKIWLHTHDSLTEYMVKIHIMEEGAAKNDEGFHQARTRINNHLNRELGFPMRGKYEPYSGFMGDDRETIKVPFEYFISDD